MAPPLSALPLSLIERVPLASIIRDPSAQPRAQFSMEIAKGYAEEMAAGAKFPPIVVYSDGKKYFLADGSHRLIAADLNGAADIEAEVVAGSLRDAILHAVGANATHGYQRTKADKRRAVEILLADAEWAAWSNRAIARRCNVSADLVGSLRPAPSDGDGQIARKVERGGKVYEMKTEAIGREKQAKQPAVGDATVGEEKRSDPADAEVASPSVTYDFAGSQVRSAVIDAISSLAKAPEPESLASLWATFDGRGLPDGTVEGARDWLDKFATLFPEAEARRQAASTAMLRRL